MDRQGKFVFAGILALVSAILFLSAAKVALSARTDSSPQPSKAQASLTWEDFDRIFQDDWIAVGSPPGFTPEEVLAAILENRTLPRHIREPFVALARVKAPHLVTAEDATQSLYDQEHRKPRF